MCVCVCVCVCGKRIKEDALSTSEQVHVLEYGACVLGVRHVRACVCASMIFCAKYNSAEANSNENVPTSSACATEKT